MLYYSLNGFISKNNYFIFIYNIENTLLIVKNSTFCSIIFVYKIISKIKYINKFKFNNNNNNNVNR